MTITRVPEGVRAAAARVPSRIGQTVVERALAMYDAGAPMHVIERDLCIGHQTLCRWVEHSGMVRRGKGGADQCRLNAVEQERRERALRDHSGSLSAAAADLGIHRTTLSVWATRHAPDLIRTRTARVARRDEPERVVLPVEPIAQWLDEQIARGAVIEEMAERAGMSARRLNSIQLREYRTVSLRKADVILTSAGVPLSAIYPDHLLA